MLEFISLFELGLLYVATLILAILIFFFVQFRRQLRETERRERIANAIDFIREYSSPSFLGVWHSADIADYLFDEDLLLAMHNGDQALRDVIDVLSFFERLALAVEYGGADEELLNRYFSRSAVDVFSRFEGIILFLRETTGNSSLFKSFEKLVGRWSFSRPVEKLSDGE